MSVYWRALLETMQWLVLLSALALAGRALLGGWGERHRLDWVYLATLLPFAGLAGVHLLATGGWPAGEWLVGATRVMYQLMIISVTVFVMVLLRGGGPMHHVLLGIQSVVGLGLAAWPAATWPWPGVPAWEWFNLGFTTLLIAMMAHALWRHGATRGWTMLLAAIAALGVMSSDMDAAQGGVVAASWPQVLYSLIMLVLWLMATRRVRGGRHGENSTQVRRQLAQDLHDGVGSHLTSIISALDAGSPDQRTTAARLRECQVELKLLVDGVDEDASVLSLLASLRYRMQPLLDDARIDLRWLIADEEVLDSVRGDAARHVLRIAQEALANVVRHSGASAVTVVCSHARSAQALRLEIADNGVGLPLQRAAGGASDAPLGKGLSGIRARARQLGAQLSFESRHGQGVRMVLRVPLALHQPPVSPAPGIGLPHH
ncbi:MAG TPA: hypothetical protein PKA16_07050 [Ottowia sp.]|uniref:sensor histidine kinase n=1 Tax=Ottowia sp. TaxID=1898956 RepID=UPI002C208275|nr:ATP-binding protein [Ottowia sp.]HMN21133.1 hypothetical protein [Ottowia sp.]